MKKITLDKYCVAIEEIQTDLESQSVENKPSNYEICVVKFEDVNQSTDGFEFSCDHKIYAYDMYNESKQMSIM